MDIPNTGTEGLEGSRRLLAVRSGPVAVIPDRVAQAFAADIVARLSDKLSLSPPPAVKVLASREQIDGFCDRLVGGERRELVSILERARADGASADALYQGYIAGAARRLGARWDTDRASFFDVTVGVGHLQALVRDLGPVFFQREPTPGFSQTALFAAVPGEHHLLGLSMAADYFRRGGWRVEVLTDKDSAELVTRARLLAPELVGLSAGSRRMIGPLADTIARLKAVLPNARICVGGYLTTLEPDLAGIVGADHLSTDAASSAMALRPGSERVGRASR